jgi:hypothetical protein
MANFKIVEIIMAQNQLTPKINTTTPMSVSHPSSIRPLLYIQITSSHVPECFPLSPVEQFFCRNDDVLPTADASTECFKENLLPNGALLPNSAHMSVFSLNQFLVLTIPDRPQLCASLWEISSLPNAAPKKAW